MQLHSMGGRALAAAPWRKSKRLCRPGSTCLCESCAALNYCGHSLPWLALPLQVFKNANEMYSEQDLYVGKVLPVHHRTFELLEADEFTYQVGGPAHLSSYCLPDLSKPKAGMLTLDASLPYEIVAVAPAAPAVQPVTLQEGHLLVLPHGMACNHSDCWAVQRGQAPGACQLSQFTDWTCPACSTWRTIAMCTSWPTGRQPSGLCAPRSQVRRSIFSPRLPSPEGHLKGLPRHHFRCLAHPWVEPGPAVRGPHSAWLALAQGPGPLPVI